MCDAILAKVLRAEFKRGGGRTLREEGVLKSLEGMSSLEEVLRVTHSEDYEPIVTERPTHRPTPTLHQPPAPAHPPKAPPVKEVA